MAFEVYVWDWVLSCGAVPFPELFVLSFVFAKRLRRISGIATGKLGTRFWVEMIVLMLAQHYSILYIYNGHAPICGNFQEREDKVRETPIHRPLIELQRGMNLF